ncbi:MAG: transporter, partial [Deltaproteobacteria bacterium]|nr:transporter [Deltaproteobacteria bacterium]
MSKHCLVFVYVIVIGLFLGISIASAQEHPMHDGEGEWMEPPEETATVQSVTTIVTNPVVINPTFSAIPAPTPAAPSIMPGAIEASLQTLYSSPIQVYNIPLSYAFTENLKMELSIPYLRKQIKGEYTGADLTASGLGDITVGGKYRYGDINKYQWITSFYIKLPTGDNELFEDQQEQLALGTGSYDFIISQSVSRLFRNFLVTANVGYTINTTGDYTAINSWGVNARYENRAGNVFNYLAGAEYYTPMRKLLAYANLAGIIMGNSH